MVQLRRRACLGLKSPHVSPVGAEPWVHDLERHPALERFMLGLVHDPHPASTDAANQDEVTQTVSDRDARAKRLHIEASPLVLLGANLLHDNQSGKHGANPLGQIGIFVRVFAERRPLAPAVPLEESVGQIVDRVEVTRRLAHGLSSPSPPGAPPRICLSRSRARMYRLPAAPSEIPSTCAFSARLNCSKWRKASTSRSSGSMLLSPSCTRIFSSARTAASLGRVSCPKSWPASAADDASGNGPAQRYLLAGGAHLDAQMMSVQRHQLLTREKTEPQEEWHRWITQVLGQSTDASRYASWMTSEGSIRPCSRRSILSATMRSRSPCRPSSVPRPRWSPWAACSSN